MWKPPNPGDIVWGLYPTSLDDNPGEKPRPCLVVAVFRTAETYQVSVAHGTSKKLDKLYAGDVCITEKNDGTAYKEAGLEYDTKFRLSDIRTLPWNEIFFREKAGSKFANHPKIGVLHESMIRKFSAAYNAVKNK